MIQFFIKYKHNDNEQFQISKKMKTRYKKSKKKYYIIQYVSPITYTHIFQRERYREKEGGRGKEEGKEGGKKRRKYCVRFFLSSCFPLSHLFVLIFFSLTDLVHDNKWAIYAANAHHQVFSFRKMRVFQ